MESCPTYHVTTVDYTIDGDQSLCIRMLVKGWRGWEGESKVLFTENCGTSSPVKWDINEITFLDLKLSPDCFNNFEFKKFVELYLTEGPKNKILHVCNDYIDQPLTCLNEWDIFCDMLVLLEHPENKINIHLEIFNLDYNKKAEHVFNCNKLKKINFSKFRQIDYFYVVNDNESYHYPTYSKFYDEGLTYSLEQWSKNYSDDPILAQERLINQKGIRHDPKADREFIN